MFSKSRSFLALILLGQWVRASGGAPPEGVNPYWTLCTEASQINGLLIDLGVISTDQRRDDDLIYVGLRGVPTQHEKINLQCIYNETRVFYPKTNQTAFSK